MRVYYNEIDPFCCAWLKELIKAGEIPDGEIDSRSIADVRPDDLRGFGQCHFFAGIGGWAYALKLAGWPDDREVWTGSCPCQQFSSASRGRKTARDWWPEWHRLIVAARPATLLGEQVSVAHAWLDRAWGSLELEGYELWPVVLPAVCLGFDHTRERLYFAGHTNRKSESGRAVDAEVARVPRYRSDTGNMVPTDGVSSRVAQLRAFGNAIVPQVAATFIEAYLDLSLERTA